MDLMNHALIEFGKDKMDVGHFLSQRVKRLFIQSLYLIFLIYLISSRSVPPYQHLKSPTPALFWFSNLRNITIVTL